MAYLAESREDCNRPWKWTLCLNAYDCRLLLPTMEKRLKEAEKKYEKYYDIQYSGEATTQQQNLLMKYEEEMNAVDKIVTHAKNLIKDSERKTTFKK